jgi:hypothetical protein
MKSRLGTPLWLTAALVLGGALFSCGPSLMTAPDALAARTGSCVARQAAITAADPEAAAALADAIWSNPDQAGCILATHSMSSGDLQKVMMDIAGTSEASERYARARRIGRRL